MYDIGVVVSAQGLPRAEIDQFKAALEASAPSCSYVVEIVTDSVQPHPAFSKPIAINVGLKKLLPICRHIVQTDIDVLIPPGALDHTVACLDERPNDCFWIVSRELHHFDGDYRWAEWMNNTIRENMSGCWIAMASHNWWLVGGYNEDLWGWGSDDWEIARRITYRGIAHHKIYDYALMHIEHAHREYKSRERLMRNDEIRIWTPKCKNFLHGRNPGFIIVGAQKSGTSYLIDSLEKHPDIFVARAQTDVDLTAEVHFFNRKWDRGAEWYRSHFVCTERIAGEKTPEYFNSPVCHDRMKAVCPDAKLIVLFRDPVARAYSALNHARQVNGHWTGHVYPSLNLPDAFRMICAKQHHALIDFSTYAPKLANLFRLFPREQIHIDIFERVVCDKLNAYNRVCRFLDVPELTEPVDFRISNERDYPDPMPEDVADELRERLAPSVAQLRDMLQDEIPEWSL